MARRRGTNRRRSGRGRSRGAANQAGFLLLVALVFIGLFAVLSSQSDKSDGDTGRERSEAAQAAENADARDGNSSGLGGDGGGEEIGGAKRSASDLLATLVVRDEGSRTGYEREAFGDGWAVDDHGCDTRELVLAQESKAPITRRADCSVVEGRWLSLYDGDTTRDPEDLQIDHMVPLAEAWESGAAAWPTERRERYANDMRRHGALIAVTSAMNQSKSDRDPAEWMPPDRGVWCRYINAWIVQKHDWHLTVDRAEVRALRNVVATC
ncbi:MAG TPA: HNH endonuclease family protein [Acidimicrobiales bacterium]|jgi:hypothetical protein|nr:HNH endonuclease family protein [Acidimicrobiales bacterium]